MLLNFLNLILYFLIYHRQLHRIESIVCKNLKTHFFFLKTIDILSFSINIIFRLETFLSVISSPDSILKIWQVLNVFFVACSISLLYLNVLSSTKGTLYSFIDDLLLSSQIFRFFLMMKHVKFIKKFLKTFKTIIIKSFPIIILFFIVIFFYGLIGTLPPKHKFYLFFFRSSIVSLSETPKIREFGEHKF